MKPLCCCKCNAVEDNLLQRYVVSSLAFGCGKLRGSVEKRLNLSAVDLFCNMINTWVLVACLSGVSGMSRESSRPDWPRNVSFRNIAVSVRKL